MTNAQRSFRPNAATIPATGEVEVARICYPDTTLSDIVSVLASRHGGRIVYRVVTDNADECYRRRPVPLPLTTGQMVRLIDRSRQGVAYWYYLIRECDVRRADLPAFQVFSDCYPQLRGYFAERAAAFRSYWSAQRQRRLRPAPDDVQRIRRGLLVRLRWEECSSGIARSDADRDARADYFLALRFG